MAHCAAKYLFRKLSIDLQFGNSRAGLDLLQSAALGRTDVILYTRTLIIDCLSPAITFCSDDHSDGEMEESDMCSCTDDSDIFDEDPHLIEESLSVDPLSAQCAVRQLEAFLRDGLAQFYDLRVFM